MCSSDLDLGFINMTPVDLVLQITHIDTATNELELALVSVGCCDSADNGAAIGKWFKDIYPSRSKENCLLKNARAFEQLLDLKLASPDPALFA